MAQQDWMLEEISEIYHAPLLPLIARAHALHGQNHSIDEVQVCSLLSFKTGGCPEDCKYCPQSARWSTSVVALPLMQEERMLAEAKKAIACGATRICIGAAWREIREGKAFDTILATVNKLTELGVEVCCTLGMLTQEQAAQLKEAGLFAYNHNLDTSQNYYEEIITTRSYDERLETLKRVKLAGISVCCGGIIGMGESSEDRVALLYKLANLKPYPESVPINFLIPIPGTPLEDRPPMPIWEMLRMIATARIIMPKAMIRLSAGRLDRTPEEQLLCFLAGANSIFSGDKLLTTPNPSFGNDEQLFKLFGLKKRPPFKASRDQKATYAESKG
jgi:biotin synthase